MLVAPVRAYLDTQSSSSASPSSSAAAEVVEFQDLVQRRDLSGPIQRAYGPDGLGILVVSGVPNLPQLRKRLLHLAHALAHLPPDVLQHYVDVLSHYSFGWSRGKESLKNGQPDTFKGSYYANPLMDDQLRPGAVDVGSGLLGARMLHVPRLTPEAEAQLRLAHPAYLRPNVWPTDALPDLEPALKELGRLVCDVGVLLADACDSYVASRLPGMQPGQLADVLRRSTNPKARLLHYYPAPAPAEAEAEDLWCGWHLDHGSLTGLTAALYTDARGAEVPCPDPAAGLYIRDRHGRVVRVSIPPACLAFQVGEAMQVHSGGLLRATPHCVRASSSPTVGRNTLAVFMQPNIEEPLDCPPGCRAEDVAVGQWRPGMSFGSFAEATFAVYYGGAGTGAPAQ